jgi:hypothetical protein
MWRKIGEATGQWKNLRNFFISSRRSLTYSSAACRASSVRRLSVRDCLSAGGLSGRSSSDALPFPMLD